MSEVPGSTGSIPEPARPGRPHRVRILAALAAALIVGGLIDRAGGLGADPGGRISAAGAGGRSRPGAVLVVVLRGRDRRPPPREQRPGRPLQGTVVIANSRAGTRAPAW